MDKNIKWFRDKKCERLAEVLLGKEFEAIIVENIEEIKKIIFSRVSQEKSFILGDSNFLEKENFEKDIKEKGYKIFDYYSEKDLEKKEEIKRQGLLADNFITEIDFVTESGELLVQGGFTACASIFGPNKIFGIVNADSLIKTKEIGIKKIDDIMMFNSLRDKKNEDKELYRNFSIINNGRKFPYKYTIFIVRD